MTEIHLDPALGDAERAQIGGEVELILQLYSTLAIEFGIEMPGIEVWLLPQPRDSIEHLVARAKGAPLEPSDVERMGVVVMGKSVALADDWSRAAVVAPGVYFTSGDMRGRALAHSVLGHELTHVIIEALGVRSGAREAVWSPSASPLRKARGAARRWLDELRATTVSNQILAKIFRDSAGVPVSSVGLLGATYRDSLGDLLESVYPGWPDAVDAYRQTNRHLADTWARICEETVHCFTMLGHCEAEARALGRPAPLDDEWEHHPAACLYLNAPLKALADDEMPIMPAIAEFRSIDDRVLGRGSQAILDMWERVGLTFDLLEHGGLHIHVKAPVRR